MRLRPVVLAAAAGAMLVAVVLAAPGGAASAPEPSAPSALSSPAPAAPLLTPVPDPTPIDPIAELSTAERVGQLFMVGTPVDRAAGISLAAVEQRHVGGVFLHGRSDAGTAPIARVTARFRHAAAKAGIPLWIATDQEGGEVQVLSGAGFDAIPAARRQAGTAAAELRVAAARWGAQLRAAGVTMNLAPVADIVTSRDRAAQNAPIGALWREYGYDRADVAAKAGAFAAGMRDAGVVPTFKHFPGLGRVRANTDYSADVVDTAVGSGSPDVAVYRDLTASGACVVMVGTAEYERIDPGMPAAFSRAVVTDVLRGDVGFDGVVVTDDLSATAQVQRFSPAERAVRAIEAGVDLVLVSADPRLLPEMYDAVLAKAEGDPVFAEKVDEAARRIVVAKRPAPPAANP